MPVTVLQVADGNTGDTIIQNGLLDISYSIIGDNNAKIRLLLDYINEDSSILSLSENELNTERCLTKLNIFIVLANLDLSLRNNLKSEYDCLLNKIFNETSFLASNIDELSPRCLVIFTTLIKYCIENSPSDNQYPNFLTQLTKVLINLIDKSLKVPLSPDESQAVIELLNLFLVFFLKKVPNKSQSYQQHSTWLNLKKSIQKLLISISLIYIDEVDLKYETTTYLNRRPSKPFVMYNCMSNKNLENSSNLIPNKLEINNYINSEILSLSLILYSALNPVSSRSKNLWNNLHFNIFISAFLKSNDHILKCSSIYFLLYPFLNNKIYRKNTKRLKEFLPYLVDCFNLKNIPWWYDPFEILNSLLNTYNKVNPKNNPVLNILTNTNIIKSLLALFAQCLSLKYQTNDSIKTLTKFINLSSSITAYDETYRIYFLKNKKFINHLKFAFENHLMLTKNFLDNKQDFYQYYIDNEKNEELPPFYDHEITFSWLMLMKSFSRSVTTLKTYLKEKTFAETLFLMLQNSYTILDTCEFAGSEFLECELKIFGATLGCVCNFVIEFSSLQNILVDGGLKLLIKDILTNEKFKSIEQQSNSNVIRFSESSKVIIRTYSLWILRHLMYNCQNVDKFGLLESIPLSVILDFVNDSSWEVQAQCFELLRNLTCNSRKVVNLLLESFKSIDYYSRSETNIRPQHIRSTYLFEFFARKLKFLQPSDPVQKKIIVAILYIIVNIAAVNENKKQLVIEQDEILMIIKEILCETKDRPNNKYGNDSSLKFVSLIALSNLLWDSTISRYTHYKLSRGQSPYFQHQGNNPNDIFESSGSSSVKIGETTVDIDNENSNLTDAENSGRNSNTNNDADNEDPDFVHFPSSFVNIVPEVNTAIIDRCKKLVEIGLLDIIKSKVFDEALAVREKAKILAGHMDLLLKHQQ